MKPLRCFIEGNGSYDCRELVVFYLGKVRLYYDNWARATLKMKSATRRIRRQLIMSFDFSNIACLIIHVEYVRLEGLEEKYKKMARFSVKEVSGQVVYHQSVSPRLDGRLIRPSTVTRNDRMSNNGGIPSILDRHTTIQRNGDYPFSPLFFLKLDCRGSTYVTNQDKDLNPGSF